MGDSFERAKLGFMLGATIGLSAGGLFGVMASFR
jgi:ABC-type nitrate/sulfonate/bicarbonate transport system permease component